MWTLKTLTLWLLGTPNLNESILKRRRVYMVLYIYRLLYSVHFSVVSIIRKWLTIKGGTPEGIVSSFMLVNQEQRYLLSVFPTPKVKNVFISISFLCQHMKLTSLLICSFFCPMYIKNFIMTGNKTNHWRLILNTKWISVSNFQGNTVLVTYSMTR